MSCFSAYNRLLAVVYRWLLYWVCLRNQLFLTLNREVPGLLGVGPGPSPMEYYYSRDTHGVAIRIAYAIRRLRWLSSDYPKYKFPVDGDQRPRVYIHHWCRVEYPLGMVLIGSWLSVRMPGLTPNP